VIIGRDPISQIAEIARGQKWMAQAPRLIVLCAAGVGDERGGRDTQKQRYPECAEAIAEMDQDLLRHSRSMLGQDKRQMRLVTPPQVTCVRYVINPASGIVAVCLVPDNAAIHIYCYERARGSGVS
jgi:hypothetical protein